MSSITFDTLSTSRRLREKGFPQEQAEAIADEMRINSSVDISHLSTKEEVQSFKSELKGDIKTLENAIMTRMDAKIELAKNDILKWMFAGFISVLGLLFGILMK